MKDNIKKSNKHLYFVAIISAIAIVVTITLTSYAYFTATITNTNTPTATVIETGTMALEFTDGAEVKLENANPVLMLKKHLV